MKANRPADDCRTRERLLLQCSAISMRFNAKYAEELPKCSAMSLHFSAKYAEELPNCSATSLHFRECYPWPHPLPIWRHRALASPTAKGQRGCEWAPLRRPSSESPSKAWEHMRMLRSPVPRPLKSSQKSKSLDEPDQGQTRVQESDQVQTRVRHRRGTDSRSSRWIRPRRRRGTQALSIYRTSQRSTSPTQESYTSDSAASQGPFPGRCRTPSFRPAPHLVHTTPTQNAPASEITREAMTGHVGLIQYSSISTILSALDNKYCLPFEDPTRAPRSRKAVYPKMLKEI